jgi:hypothetical protein
MLNTYIKNRGSTKTIIHDNNQNNVNVIEWDADYDGNEANVSLDLVNNGKTEHYNVKLDNDDLANILNIKSVQKPIHKRLTNDFKNVRFHKDPSMYNIYLDDFSAPTFVPPIYENNLISKYNPTISLELQEEEEEEEEEEDPMASLGQLLQIEKPKHTHFSSPLTDEELIIPLTIDKNTDTPSKNYRRRPYKTHRVYKRRYTHSNVGKGLNKNKNKSKRKTRRKNKNN